MNAELTLNVNIYCNADKPGDWPNMGKTTLELHIYHIACLLLRKCERSNSRIAHRILRISQSELAVAHRLRNHAFDENNNA